MASMKKKNTRNSAVSKLLPPPPTITHQFQATEAQLIQAVCHTPNNNHDNSSPRAATPAAHPESCSAEFMGIQPLTFSSSQEPMRDNNVLYIGRKRKTAAGAILRSPDSQSMQPTELPSPDYVSWYVKDRLIGKITCMVCGEEGHYTCDCPMKDQENKVICTLCNKVGHCHLWCCRQNVSENRACCRCGEKGHYTNKDLTHCGEKYTSKNLGCSSCDINHPLGKCPMGKVTCFLCEGNDHVPAQCRFSPILTAVTQCHRESFRAALKQAMTEPSRRTVTSVKPPGEREPYDDSHECHFKGSREVITKVSGCNHSEKANRDAESPVNSQVPASDKNNPAETLASPLGVTCFICHDKGHYSYMCPKKKPPGELELYDVTCVDFNGKGRKNKTPGRLELCDVTCFNCHDKGHYSYTCPKKDPLEESEPHVDSHECQFKGGGDTVPEVSRFSRGEQEYCDRKSTVRSQVSASGKTKLAATMDEPHTRASGVICYNCHDKGHYANMCPKRIPLENWIYAMSTAMAMATLPWQYMHAPRGKKLKKKQKQNDNKGC
ncbi:hypothetical protein ACP70R_045343 [Stipagrostis hirtigluma subsp. patula]